MKFILLLLMPLCISTPFSWAEPWVVVANGPEILSSELEKTLQNRKVLVLDGAANRLKGLSFFPDVILGDFDSIEDPAYWGILETFSEINESSNPYKGNFSVTIVPAKDQDHTDLEKAIMYCDKKGADSILIVQATGGRMDHTLGNLGILKKYHQKNRPLIIETEIEHICYLNDEEITIENGKGGYCAIMGYPEARMTTSGLAYNGKGYPLQLGIQESLCNTVIDPEASIAIHGEALVILPKSSTFTTSSLCE